MFRVVSRRLSQHLAMVALRPGVSVNGLDALPVSILGPRDTVTLGASSLCYVTARIRPHVGPPAAEHLGMRCPVCRIKVEKSTRIVTCRCGAVYHFETAESHPHLQEQDRLKCFEKIKVCLSCQRPVTVKEYLEWDPREL
jgi:hypothetical protein